MASKLGLAVLVGSLMSLALLNGFLRPLELQSGDLLFRLKPDTTAKWTVLVAIDDCSLAELRSKGRFYNWPRDLHAKVTGRAKYAEDYRAEGMLFAKLLLSPLPLPATHE